LVGGSGTDTLVAAVASSVASLNTTGIEQINFTVNGASVLNMAGAAGVTGITVQGDQVNVNTLTLNNLASVPTVDFNTPDDSLTLNFSNAALAGSSDDIQINLNGTSLGGGTALALTRAAGATNTLETVSLNSGATSNTIQDLQTTEVGAVALEITGDQNLTITTELDNEIATVSAGSATGALVFSVGTGNKTITTGSGADNITGNTGNDNITSGDGADTISSSTGTDTINAGGGNDRIKFANGALTSVDVVDGGTGTNTIEFTTDGTTVVDADLTGVVNVQVLTTTADAQLTSLTLGALAAAAGVTTVNLRDTTAVDSVTVGAGFTNNLTVDLDIDTDAANSVVATAYTGALTVTAADTDIDTRVVTITGGTGSDTLAITASGGTIEAADLASVTKVETFQIVGTTASISLTLSDANAVGTGVAADETITVNASALTTGVATIDASAENDAKVVITGGGAADIITASTSANWGDTINGGAGNDTIKFANGALTSVDVVDGGTGTNTIEFTTDGTTVVDADLTGVVNVQVLTTTADAQLTSLTLGALAAAAGVTTVNLRDTTAVDSVTVGAGFTNNLTVDLDIDTDAANSVVATAYTGALTVTAADTDIDTRVVTITGGTGSDTLAITASGGTIEAVDLASVTKVETFQIVGTTASISLTLSDNNAAYTNAASYETITVNASALTTGVATIDASAENDSKVVIIGGGAADIITASTSANFGDNISGGAGNDTIKLSADGALTYIDTIDGGAGDDTLSFVASSTVADVDFTNVSSIKTLSSNAAADNSVFTSLTLGALAQAAGVSVITTTGTGNDVVTVGAGFTNALTVNLATGDDKVDGSASAAALSIAAAAASITANDTIKGGTSTGDTLSLTADDGTATTTLMTGIDTITVVYAADKDVSITMGANDTQIASGATLTVNASAMTETDEVFTFTGTSSETNGYLSITGGSGNDVITGAGAADTISGGAGADVITGGAGGDRLTGGAGADTFVYTAVAQSSGAATDTITDFVSGTDKLRITLDYSSLTTAQTVNATILTAAAGLTNAQASLSGERGQFIYDTDNSKLYINVNADNLITSLDYSIGITAATTAASTIADGDLNISVTGGSGADTITTGGGADTITGGTGADTINVGGGANTVNFAVADAIRATVDLTQGDDPAALDDGDTFTGVFDQIFSIASGDTLDFLALTLASEAADGGAGANKYQSIQGTYAAGVFTVDGTTGTDTLIVWNDGTNGDNAVVLVGIVDLTGVTIA